MEQEELKYERINELKNKLDYAENVRDMYKETHPILYQTNSLYIDTLKCELKGIECAEWVLIVGNSKNAEEGSAVTRRYHMEPVQLFLIHLLTEYMAAGMVGGAVGSWDHMTMNMTFLYAVGLIFLKYAKIVIFIKW